MVFPLRRAASRCGSQNSEPPGASLEHPQHYARVLEEERLELSAWNGQAAKECRRDHVGGRSVAGQRRDLAEEVSASEPSAFGLVDDHPRLTFEDDVEAAAAHALAEDTLPVGEHLLIDRVGDLLELRLREVCEQRQLRERVNDGSRLSGHGGRLVRGTLLERPSHE